jgi:hypothetical protein
MSTAIFTNVDDPKMPIVTLTKSDGTKLQLSPGMCIQQEYPEGIFVRVILQFVNKDNSEFPKLNDSCDLIRLSKNMDPERADQTGEKNLKYFPLTDYYQLPDGFNNITSVISCPSLGGKRRSRKSKKSRKTRRRKASKYN